MNALWREKIGYCTNLYSQLTCLPSPDSDSGGGWAAEARRRAPPPGTWRMSCWPPRGPAPRPGSSWSENAVTLSSVCSVSVTLCHCHIHEQSYESQTWRVLIKLTGEFINKLQTWHGESILIKLDGSMCLLLIYYLHIYLFFVPIISTDCWGQFVWISRPPVSCSPGLSPAARCRCRDLGREPWQVISVMSGGRRHYGQPQGSLQLFEADSFFVDESCIMQPISNLIEKVKPNKCFIKIVLLGVFTNDPFWSFFSAQISYLWTSQMYLTLNIPKYRNRRCDDNFISWKSSLNNKMTPFEVRTVTVRYPVWDVSKSLTISATFRFAGIIWGPPIWVRVTCLGWALTPVELVKGRFLLSAASSNNFFKIFCQGWGVF